ncbi:hypothetical protein C8R44DRAFT_886884 [Mycena epipterygia]|nr:hypothetical protein C8R44DRAFT_886884 [Mycena epipterygia]
MGNPTLAALLLLAHTALSDVTMSIPDAAPANHRQAAAGRNWEGFGAEPFLAGAAFVATMNGD